MKRTLSLALMAGSASFAAPVKAPATAPMAAPAPVAVQEQAPVSAAVYQAPVTVAATPASSSGSTAPLAPMLDGFMQNNPAVPGTMASALSIPHRWAGKRVAVFEWSGTNDVKASGTIDNYFAGFKKSGTSGDITGGYTVEKWSAGMTLNFNRQYESHDPVGEDSIESISGAFKADGFDFLGSYKLDHRHLYGNLSWRTADSSIKVTASNGSTINVYQDTIALMAGVRTYVTGTEGLAWRAQARIENLRIKDDGISNNYSGSLKGSAGYRFTSVNNSNLIVGSDAWFTNTNYKSDPDYKYEIGIRPVAVVVLPLSERWGLYGGAGVSLSYKSLDNEAGSKAVVESALLTTAPTGNVALRYARDNWSAQAGINSAFLSEGPNFITGGTVSGALMSFALTANFK